MHKLQTLLGLLLASVASAPVAAVPVSGDPVLYWNELFLGATPFNPGQQRPAAILNIALHDAINSTLGRPDYSYVRHVVTPGGDTRVAAAVAAHDVLVNLVPTRAAEFDAALTASLALVPDSVAKANGIVTGAKTAAAALANRAGDGTFDVVSYTPSGLPGRWAPTPPGLFPAIQPQLATTDPWIMASNGQFRAAAPPALDSAAYTAAFNEVRDIGSATSLTRTEDQTASALYWAGASGPGPWLRAAIDLSEANGLSTLDNARTFARLAVGVADAVIVAWDSKFAYDYWRPVTAIRAADTDGNPDTLADPAWNSLFPAPAHPSYISAHSTISATAATILTATFGDDQPFCVTSAGTTRCWSGFGAAALDSSLSRLWGGIHWRFDSEAGLFAGNALGEYVLASNAFAAVPEPAAWTLMIVGFGLVGGALRRRQTTSMKLSSTRFDPAFSKSISSLLPSIAVTAP